MSFDDFIKSLSKADLARINEAFAKQQESKPVYSYSSMTDVILDTLFKISISLDRSIFNEWFDNAIHLDEATLDFIADLLKKESVYLDFYSEEDLKIKFLAPLLNRIDFKINDNLRDFYEAKLNYETDDFMLTGTTDFMVSQGLKRPKKPYFFIQEFKKSKNNSDPEPQLIAELISAVELNAFKTMKGAFIVGGNWNFVILQRLEKHQYRYFISQTFNAESNVDLQQIYRNLLYVKQEIQELVKGEL